MANTVIQNPNWYEGFAKRTPSTNNALESKNRLIKDEGTLRERMDLGQFRIKLFEMLRKWSVEYQSGLNKMNNETPNIVLKLWTDGYNWAKSNVKSSTVIEKNQTIYRSVVVSDNDPTKINQQHLKNIKIIWANRLLYRCLSEVGKANGLCLIVFVYNRNRATEKNFFAASGSQERSNGCKAQT